MKQGEQGYSTTSPCSPQEKRSKSTDIYKEVTDRIVAEMEKGICRTIELDEKFCDVIVKRYIELVGSSDEITVARDGLTYRFDEICDTDLIPLF